MSAFQKLFFLLQNTPLAKKMLTLDAQLSAEDSESLSSFRKAAQNAGSIMALKTRDVKEVRDVKDTIDLQNIQVRLNHPKPVKAYTDANKLSQSNLKALDSAYNADKLVESRSVKEERLMPPLAAKPIDSGAHSVSGNSHRALKNVYVNDSMVKDGLLANSKIETQRSKSLIRGSEKGRQANFEAHVEKYNQFDTLLKG